MCTHLTNTSVAKQHYLRLQLRRSSRVCLFHVITSHLLSRRMFYLKHVEVAALFSKGNNSSSSHVMS